MEAAILATFLTFDAFQGATGHFGLPIAFYSPSITLLIVGGLGPARQASKIKNQSSEKLKSMVRLII